MHKLFTVHVCTEQVSSAYTEHAASGLPNSTHLEGVGWVRFVQAQDQQVVTTRSPRIVTECLFTNSNRVFTHSLDSAQSFLVRAAKTHIRLRGYRD